MISDVREAADISAVSQDSADAESAVCWDSNDSETAVLETVPNKRSASKPCWYRIIGDSYTIETTSFKAYRHL